MLKKFFTAGLFVLVAMNAKTQTANAETEFPFNLDKCSGDIDVDGFKKIKIKFDGQVPPKTAMVTSIEGGGISQIGILNCSNPRPYHHSGIVLDCNILFARDGIENNSYQYFLRVFSPSASGGVTTIRGGFHEYPILSEPLQTGVECTTL